MRSTNSYEYAEKLRDRMLNVHSRVRTGTASMTVDTRDVLPILDEFLALCPLGAELARVLQAAQEDQSPENEEAVDVAGEAFARALAAVHGIEIPAPAP